MAGSEDSGMIVTDMLNLHNEAAGPTRRPVVLSRISVKLILTVIGAILSSAVYLGYHYSQMCSQMDLNTLEIGKVSKSHEATHTEVKAHGETLIRVETNQNHLVKQIDGQGVMLTKIVDRLGAN